MPQTCSNTELDRLVFSGSCFEQIEANSVLASGHFLICQSVILNICFRIVRRGRPALTLLRQRVMDKRKVELNLARRKMTSSRQRTGTEFNTRPHEKEGSVTTDKNTMPFLTFQTTSLLDQAVCYTYRYTEDYFQVRA